MSIIRDAYGNDNILQRICKLIGVFDKLDEEKKFEKFDKEFETFREFFLNQDVLFIFYLYKDNTDTEQCIDSDTFFSIIKWMVKNRELLKKNVILNEKYEEFLRDYRKAEMGYYEGLQKLNNPVDRIIYSAREQNIRREELEQLIMKSNNLSTNEERYLKGHNRYYKSFYYTALSIYNSHFTDIPEEEIEKKNPKFIKFIKDNVDKNCKSEIIPYIPLREQEISKETEAILALMYKNYFMTEEEKEELQKEEQEMASQIRINNNTYDIFKKKKTIKPEVEQNKLVSVEKISLFKRILNKIKKFFDII